MKGEKMRCPKISIIMGVYNCAETIDVAIDSIMNQTYNDYEFIICDDASTDNTFELVEKWSKKYPGVFKVIRNADNHRLAYSLNHCLKYARGEYIARMDGDDLSVSDRFEKQVKYLDEHPECDVVGSYYRRFNDEGLMDIVSVPINPDKYTVRRSVPFNHATIMMRKSVYDALNGYTVNELTSRCEDQEMWFRFFKLGFKGANIPEPLYMVREDMNAIKRRTVRVRWQSYKVMRNGYKLLEFPWYWRIKPFVLFLIKSMTPYRIQMAYRNYLASKDKI